MMQKAKHSIRPSLLQYYPFLVTSILISFMIPSWFLPIENKSLDKNFQKMHDPIP
jgi:hypothetical protein